MITNAPLRPSFQADVSSMIAKYAKSHNKAQATKASLLERLSTVEATARAEITRAERALDDVLKAKEEALRKIFDIEHGNGNSQAFDQQEGDDDALEMDSMSSSWRDVIIHRAITPDSLLPDPLIGTTAFPDVGMFYPTAALIIGADLPPPAIPVPSAIPKSRPVIEPRFTSSFGSSLLTNSAIAQFDFRMAKLQSASSANSGAALSPLTFGEIPWPIFSQHTPTRKIDLEHFHARVHKFALEYSMMVPGGIVLESRIERLCEYYQPEQPWVKRVQSREVLDVVEQCREQLEDILYAHLLV